MVVEVTWNFLIADGDYEFPDGRVVVETITDPENGFRRAVWVFDRDGEVVSLRDKLWGRLLDLAKQSSRAASSAP